MKIDEIFRRTANLSLREPICDSLLDAVFIAGV
jgi:hypothetical protein